ncbi:ATP-binding cassette domain-containing protein [Clostridium sp.]|uniref:ATP-binding cassette domain-containing protein n=1 Tax=Clostridium sp. TaxID=1506 RepID=UPI003D6D5C7A
MGNKDMNNILSIKDMKMKAGKFELGPINLDINRGEVFALLGKTGAGKTLLIELIAGFYNDYHGTIKVFSDFPIGIVFQDCGLFPHLTVEDNITYGLKCRHSSKDETKRKLEDITNIFGISHLLKQYPNTLSGGERQRTALARTMILRPELLLLDEPFSALDVSTKGKIYEQIQMIKEKFNCTIILITHDFHEAVKLADRIGILLNGRIRDVVASNELFMKREDEEINEFLGVDRNYDEKGII